MCEAINVLQVSRLDHGVRSMEDPALVAYLARTQLPLTVCPLSNVKLGIFPALKHHHMCGRCSPRACGRPSIPTIPPTSEGTSVIIFLPSKTLCS